MPTFNDITADNDWNNFLNWDTLAIPVNGDDVTILGELTTGPSSAVTIGNYTHYNNTGAFTVPSTVTANGSVSCGGGSGGGTVSWGGNSSGTTNFTFGAGTCLGVKFRYHIRSVVSYFRFWQWWQ